MFCSLFSNKSFIYKNSSPRNRGGPLKTEPVTDLTKWRISNVDGRQTWHFMNSNENLSMFKRPQTFLEKYLLGIDEVVTRQPGKLGRLEGAAWSGMEFLCKRQSEDGHWPGDYGGPLFLMPGLIISCHMTSTELDLEQKLEMVRYIRSVQCPEGGWGLHIEGPATVLGTTLNYVCLRLLGVSPNDLDLLRALHLLQLLGGPLSIPSWGKFWLSVLNVYSWDGMHSLLPELWYLPEFIPFHPSKMWCHCRQVYLGMSYCYGNRLVAKETEIIHQLREELYGGEYDDIDWRKHRNNVSAADLYTPRSCLLDVVFCLLDAYEYFHLPSLRKKSLDVIHEHVCFDDEVTHAISIGPVSKTIQMIVRWHRDGPEHEQFVEHQLRIRDYLWLGRDGMKMSGTNGSQVWDTAFALQALLEYKSIPNSSQNINLDKVLKKGKEFLLVSQISRGDPRFEKYCRHPNKGGFPFSTRDCGWIVFDCTAEGVKTLMMSESDDDGDDDDDDKSKLKCKEDGWSIDERCITSIDLLLGGQNDDGGYATYERKRGGMLMEMINPSEVFGDIMIDYSYIECTSAVLQAFKYFIQKYPKYRPNDIKRAMDKGFDYILTNQREDGSWYGSWGVCFIYGTWFALEVLACKGYDYLSTTGHHPQLVKACEWLASKQNQSDGGWGENFESCELKEFVTSDHSQVVSTAWSLLGLMAVRYPKRGIIDRGIKFLLERQLQDGDFPQENVSGVFNKSCSIHYDLYRSVFPFWALCRYWKLYGKDSMVFIDEVIG